MSGSPSRPTLEVLAGRLDAGETTGVALVQACLDRIAAAGVQGRHVFPHGVSADVLEAAARQDGLRAAGRAASRFAGVPISLKDNIDQAGEVTRAGSRLLEGDAAAAADAPVAARLRAAGFVVVGRTAMTEFAFSGLGLNPHFGTPSNPSVTDTARIPGGSSAGAAVSVASGMASVAVGTDTGGSCRIPAAFCGLVGFKPTAERVPREGVFPLSTTLDCVGVLGLSARCCAIVDAVMAGAPLRRRPALDQPVRLGVLGGGVLQDLQPQVAHSYAAALDRLRAAGVEVEAVAFDPLPAVARINARGGFASAELYARLESRLAGAAARLDPRVLRRVLMAEAHGPQAYADFQADRRRLIAEADAALYGFDATLMPTTPMTAPPFAALEADDDYDRLNRLALRNPSIANMLDRCAITAPCGPVEAAPVGLTLMGRRGGDAELLALAERLEPTIREA